MEQFHAGHDLFDAKNAVVPQRDQGFPVGREGQGEIVGRGPSQGAG